jgi:hypothetical protein
MRREINVDMINEMYTTASAYPSGDASTGGTTASVMVTTADGNILPAGYAKMRGTYRAAQYYGDIMTVGGESLATYFDLKRFQGASQNYNQAAGSPLVDPMMESNFAYDIAFDQIVQGLQGDTDSYGFTWPVGALGYFEYFENLGIKAKSFEDHIRTTIEIDGMMFDYSVHYDKCTSVWQVLLKKSYALPKIPDTEYCNNQGFNYLWQFDCGDPSCATFTPVV